MTGTRATTTLTFPQLIASDIYAPPELGERVTVPTDDFTSERYRAAVDDAILRAKRLVAKQASCR